MHTFFSFLEAKEAVEAIEASDVIMSVEVIEATEVFRTTHLKINNLMGQNRPRTESPYSLNN